MKDLVLLCFERDMQDSFHLQSAALQWKSKKRRRTFIKWLERIILAIVNASNARYALELLSQTRLAYSGGSRGP